MNQSLLELLLEGRDDPFKARVWEIVQRYHLDTDDPNFQILIATGQLEVLLEIAPAQLEADMTKLVDNCQKMIQAEVRCFQESVSQTKPRHDRRRPNPRTGISQSLPGGAAQNPGSAFSGLDRRLQSRIDQGFPGNHHKLLAAKLVGTGDLARGDRGDGVGFDRANCGMACQVGTGLSALQSSRIGIPRQAVAEE
jgi:hypothetical protein